MSLWANLRRTDRQMVDWTTTSKDVPTDERPGKQTGQLLSAAVAFAPDVSYTVSIRVAGGLVLANVILGLYLDDLLTARFCIE